MPTSATGTSEHGGAAVRRSPPGRRRRGFTLLEVLVVLAIVAVLAAVAALSTGGIGSRKSENAARRAEALIGLACERAIATGRDVGIAVLADGLRFGYLQPQGWRAVGDDPADPLRPRSLGDSLQLSLERDGEVIELAEAPPTAAQLACVSSGELTPFVLHIRGPEESHLWQLTGSLDGTLQLERVGADG